MLDSYTVKKMLPRIVVAIIGIQLSWFIFTAVIHFVDLIAYGLEGIIYAPFGGAQQLNLKHILDLSGGHTTGFFLTAIIAGGAAAVGAALSLGGVVMLAVSIFIAIFMGFVLLTVRKVVIVFLLMLAPLALVAWILPGTEKYWKLWWESFIKLLLLYPMIIGLVAVGRVFAWTAATHGNPSAANPINNIADLIIIVVGCFGPFFMIPKLFQLAGSAFSNITGMVNNRSKGVFDRLRNRRQEIQKDNKQRAGSGKRFNPENPFVKRLRLNKAASWAATPGQNLAYYGRNVPGLSGKGRKLASQIEEAGLKQSTELFKEMNGMGFNDKAYRAIGGMHSGLGEDTQAKLRAAGLYGKSPTSYNDIMKMAEILGESDSATERIGANALRAGAGHLTSLYSNAEMSYADTQAAAAMGLSSHGFASGADLAQVGNELSEHHGAEFAHSVVTQAQLMGQQQRPDLKAGYGVLWDEKNKQFVDGMSDPTRARDLLKTVKQQDWIGAKSGAVKRVKGDIASLVKDGSAQKGTFDRVQSLKASGMSTEAIKQMADADGNNIGKDLLKNAELYQQAKSMEEHIMLGASSYSSSDIDAKAEWKTLMADIDASRGPGEEKLSEKFARSEAQVAAQRGRGEGAGPIAGGGEGGGEGGE